MLWPNTTKSCGRSTIPGILTLKFGDKKSMLDYIRLLTCLHYNRRITFTVTSKPTGYLSKLKEEKKQKNNSNNNIEEQQGSGCETKM